MDHPRQRISNGSCHKHREQRVLYHSAGYGSLALANVPLCLRVLFSCLSGVVLATVVSFTGRSRGTICDIAQGFPDLIEKVLSYLLPWLGALLVIRQ
jgi:hypothetical protein